ncbi:two-component regulator propeller domain-containing protein [Parafilimonas sp.]|uniref:two-component regulator propeller domain-containing protein n=1 Tax=Parafilimonas sp. TaxID=1969739 RepID=UPI0039E53B6C
MLVFFILLIAFTPINGQQNVTTKYLGIENGLSNNIVTAIFRDYNGFMWFGTYDGLNKYDGYNFKVFRNTIGDSTSVNSNIINKIDEDKLHNIWIGGQRDISIYNGATAKFSTPLYSLYNGEQVRSIQDNVIEIKMLGKNNLTLIGTEHSGLFYFKTVNNGRQVALSDKGKLIADYYVSAIEYDSIKNIAWVFIQNKGLYTYNLLNHRLVPKNNSIQNANCLKLDSEGNLWLGEGNGLHRYDYTSNTFSGNYVSEKTSVTNLIEDKDGLLWIATDGSGILLLKKDQKAALPLASVYKNGSQLINSNSIYALYEDDQQRKWIGTLRGGVNILEPAAAAFSKIVYGEGQPNISPVQNFILSFCEDDATHVWVGTDGAGLRYWNRTNNRFDNYTHNGNTSSISNDFITSVTKDAQHNIWVSTWFGGINKFNRRSKTFTRYRCFNTRTKTYNNHCWFMFEDSRKKLWTAAVRNGALYSFNNRLNSFEEFDNSLSEIQCMAEDAAGNLWCGNYASLIKLDTLHKKHIYYNIGYTVRSIHEDKNHNFWVGTQEGGLLLFNRANHSFKRFTTQDGLPNNSILRILEDGQGNLWLSTFNGLSKFNVHNNTFINFSEADGLQSNQFSFNGGLALSSGEFLFGGIKGFNIFYPDSIAAKVPERPLFLSALKINNNPVENNLEYVHERDFEKIKKVVIPYNEASLALDFLALDYKEAADLNYAYLLKGWDKNWNFVSHTRIANYSRLHEGDYVFEVKVSGPDGVWGAAQPLLQVTILPPWYRTWWAYALYIFCGVAVMYAYAQYKNRQARLTYEVQLAHLETQKEKELNEKKIDFFTDVSHEFRTPISLIINPIKDLLNKNAEFKERSDLKVIYRNAQRLLRLVDQLLLFKKAESESDKLNLVKLDFCRLCQDVFLCFTEQAKSKNIRYELHGASKRIMLEVDREKMEIALFNILSNAFKYTPEGGEIGFTVEETAKQVKVTISDSGAGIPDTEGDKLFERFYQLKRADNKSGFGIGLYLVKHFVEAHSGEVTYKSAQGTGTAFFITLNKPAVDAAAVSVEDSNDGIAILNKALPELNGAGQPFQKLSELLGELSESNEAENGEETPAVFPGGIAHEKQSLLVIDDDSELRHYLKNVFTETYTVYEAASAEEGIKIAHKQLPDLIISDIMMKGLSGIDLCKTLKEDETVSHIPIILLTASSDELQLEGMQSGADDYIKKPFDNDILQARVQSILKRRNVLQHYFYNEITLGTNRYKVSPEYKAFLENCMRIVEEHLEDEQFSIKTLAAEIGMSHSNLYKKIKTVSGQTVLGFIRYVRLKKAAELFINTENNVNETANAVGFYDVKYFRRQFSGLFGLNPSAYIKKYRKPFHNNQNLEEGFKK